MKKLLKAVLWILISLAAIAVIGVLAMRFVVLPKISDRLEKSGRAELAAIVQQSNNLGAFASITSLFTDKGMIEFVTNLDMESVSSAVDMLDTLEAEIEAEDNTEVSLDTLWKVEESAPQVVKPAVTPIPKPTEKPTQVPETAYDRITNVASDKEISDGLAIIAKLDMGYVSRLLSGGLTVPEKEELKQYIYKKLTKADISRALQLYNKYKQYL